MNTQYADTWALTEVAHNKEWNVWSTTAYDSDGNQIGESEYDHLQFDAEDTARAYLDSGRCEQVRIKGRSGTVQRTYGRKGERA